MLDVRYVAGIFDGEGLVRIARWEKPSSPHTRYQVYVCIGMTWKPLIARLTEQFGGSFHINRHSLRNMAHRDQYNWVCTSRTAHAFLTAIYPYLIVKRDEVACALRLQDSIDKWKLRGRPKAGTESERQAIFAERESLYREISALKHRTFLS